MLCHLGARKLARWPSRYWARSRSLNSRISSLSLFRLQATHSLRSSLTQTTGSGTHGIGVNLLMDQVVLRLWQMSSVTNICVWVILIGFISCNMHCVSRFEKRYPDHFFLSCYVTRSLCIGCDFSWLQLRARGFKSAFESFWLLLFSVTYTMLLGFTRAFQITFSFLDMWPVTSLPQPCARGYKFCIWVILITFVSHNIHHVTWFDESFPNHFFFSQYVTRNQLAATSRAQIIFMFGSFWLLLFPVTYTTLLGLMRAFQITFSFLDTWPIACAPVSIPVGRNLVRVDLNLRLCHSDCFCFP